MQPDDARHGTPKGRYAHLRDGENVCDECREAHNRYERRRRKSRTLYGNKWKIDATGSRRRVQALQRLGWRGDDIAELLGVHQSRVSELTRTQETVHASTAARVVSVYDRLSMRFGPSEITRKRAAAMGWPPPLAWDDEFIDDPTYLPRMGTNHRRLDDVDPVVVDRFLAGDHSLRLTKAEKTEVVRRWPGTLYQLEQIGWKPERYINRGEVA